MSGEANIEACPQSKEGGHHCDCWYDCEPCCWCGSDEGGEDNCDCPRHSAMRLAKTSPSPEAIQEWGEAAAGFAEWMDSNPDLVERYFRPAPSREETADE